MCSLTIQTEGAVNLIFGKSNPLMSAYKWEAYGSLRVAPAYTASSDLFFDPCVVPSSALWLFLCIMSQLVCLWWWLGGILVCFIVGFSQSHGPGLQCVEMYLHLFNCDAFVNFPSSKKR